VANITATSPRDPSALSRSAGTAVHLYWLPLGAGGHCVRLNGLVFEALYARTHHRKPCDLYHSALEVRLGAVRQVIEMAPVWNERTENRGVVAEGSVGMRGAGRLRLFRYEVRCWPDGRIPDIDEAVDSPRCLSTDPECAARILELVPHVPTAVWGRDELNTGDMWNSNSLISWLIARAELDTQDLHPPAGGRAPGWHAGLVVAKRGGDAGSQPSRAPAGRAHLIWQGSAQRSEGKVRS
jgi:hypothetical protein